MRRREEDTVEEWVREEERIGETRGDEEREDPTNDATVASLCRPTRN